MQARTPPSLHSNRRGWRRTATLALGAALGLSGLSGLGLQPLLAQTGKPAAKAAAAATTVASDKVALISLDDDPRYAARRLELAYPGHPGGRLLDAAQLGIDDAEVALRGIRHGLALQDARAASLEALPGLLAQLKQERVKFWLLDLPPEAVQLAVKAAGSTALLLNLSAPHDDLRGAHCAAQLLHTLPSHAMLQDALVQYLAARSWQNAWVLQGPSADDALLLAAWNRAAKRYGIKTAGIRAFKLSGDPRERDLANTRLLSADRQHDLVTVLDADGEFARTLPYATQQPRPVVGSNGLMPLAWHPQWERNGGPQVSRRFRKLAGRPMTGQDWSAWIAVRAVVAALVEQPQASAVGHARALRSGHIFVDGAKGPRLSFRAWDGQLRQ
ncbi:MAG: hypothetical protein NTX37_00515, partial [Burkholderiales bacterium]|nr:hypothetical protein [Burkholderiales bacterium]